MSKLRLFRLFESVKLGWIMGFRDFLLLGAGSRLGQWWPTIGVAIRVAFVGGLWGLVFETSSRDYVPWLASGWVVWTMLSAAITSSTESMTRSKDLMLAVPIPKEAFVVRVIVKEFLLLAQNFLVIAIVLMVFKVQISSALLLIIPGLLITAVFLYGLGLILGPLVARHRDFGPLMSSIVGVMFFVLPIMWKPQSIDSEIAHFVLGLNPLYHFLQIVRLPMLSEVPTGTNYALAMAGSVTIVFIGLRVMKKSRHRIVFWA
jgi:lipopolysaccharide transport system permease protein